MIRQIDNLTDVLPLIKATMPPDVYEQAVEVLSDDHDRVLYGWYENNKLLGCCGWYFDGHAYWVSWTAVDPAYQHQKIGSVLLYRVRNELAQRGVMALYVETYEHPMFVNAVRFYWKHGFRLCGFMENHLETGETVLYLKKQL